MKQISLRTKQTEQKYQEHLKNLPIGFCPFCNEDIEIKSQFQYWFICPNNFPYDAIYTVSDLLVCHRHVEDETELTVSEEEELKKIKRNILKENIYDVITENAKPRRTVPPHYHLHLLKY